MEETKLKEEYFLVNGKKEGIKKHYDPCKIKKICEYVNGKFKKKY